MRDPDRIDPLLSDLADLWRHDPDLRLAQLLVNLVQPSTPCPEVFSFEDRALHRAVTAALSRARRGEPPFVRRGPPR